MNRSTRAVHIPREISASAPAIGGAAPDGEGARRKKPQMQTEKAPQKGWPRMQRGRPASAAARPDAARRRTLLLGQGAVGHPPRGHILLQGRDGGVQKLGLLRRDPSGQLGQKGAGSLLGIA